MRGSVFIAFFIFSSFASHSLAIEPTNPAVLCDRFLSEKDKTSCLTKTAKMDLDWYAASACALQEDDKSFMDCLQEIQGAGFHPEGLELCTKPAELADSERLTCLKKIKIKAPKSRFQNLKIKK